MLRPIAFLSLLTTTLTTTSLSIFPLNPALTPLQSPLLSESTASSVLTTRSISTPPSAIPPARPLPILEKVDRATLDSDFGVDNQLWATAHQGGDRQNLLTAIDYSLEYLATPEAATAYRNYPVRAFTLDRVRRSLEHFRDLLQTSGSASDLRAAVLQSFDIYHSIGRDGQGMVHFTGYFEPIYRASRVPTAEFAYPLYQLPAELAHWQKPHPTRIQLEGRDGLQGAQGPLRGLELVWLPDRFEAFLVQVQGSARLQLTDSSTMTIGYAGRTDYPYVSIGRELVNDGKMQLDAVTKQSLVAYFQQYPEQLDIYLPRNDRFVFFRETNGAPPIGTFNVPVTAERSIATDKSLMPAAALALIQTEIPDRQMLPQLVDRYVLNQDTGGAIQGAGRVDIFMGSGQLAGDRAGILNAEGRLYYLLLRE